MSQKLDTSCKDCVFSVYKENTQIDCKYNRIDIVRKYNKKVLECYDDQKEFYVISNYKCPYKRTDNWKQYKEYKKGEINEKEIRNEIDMSYQIIIYDDGPLYELENTLQSTISQSLMPEHISVIRYKPDNKLSSIRNVLQQYSLPWKIINIENPDTEYIRYVDLALKSTHLSYYAVIHSGYEFEKGAFSKINDKIIDECFQFSIIYLDSKESTLYKTIYHEPNKESYFVPYIIHDLFGGNHVNKLKDKIIDKWKDQDDGICHISNI